MKNIFENAYYGKLYKTRDGRKALYLGIHPKFNTHILTTENIEKEPYWCFYSYMNNGLLDLEDPKEHPLNIVSEWEEPTNDEELDKIAIDDIFKVLNQDYFDGKISFNKIKEIYKIAYRKAKGE